MPEEVGALVAALERRAVEVADRLFEQRRAVVVVEVELAADDVDLADVGQRDAALAPRSPAPSAPRSRSSWCRAARSVSATASTSRCAPVEGARLHRLEPLDLARGADQGDPRVRRQVVLLQVEVGQRQRLVVEAAGAGDAPRLASAPGAPRLSTARARSASPRARRRSPRSPAARSAAPRRRRHPARRGSSPHPRGEAGGAAAPDRPSGADVASGACPLACDREAWATACRAPSAAS